MPLILSLLDVYREKALFDGKMSIGMIFHRIMNFYCVKWGVSDEIRCEIEVKKIAHVILLYFFCIKDNNDFLMAGCEEKWKKKY